MSEEELAEALLKALTDISKSLNSLGLNNAMTSMGAIELLAMEVKNGSERIADALERIADNG